jgi:hypothetical protein
MLSWKHPLLLAGYLFAAVALMVMLANTTTKFTGGSSPSICIQQCVDTAKTIFASEPPSNPILRFTRYVKAINCLDTACLVSDRTTVSRSTNTDVGSLRNMLVKEAKNSVSRGKLAITPDQLKALLAL